MLIYWLLSWSLWERTERLGGAGGAAGDRTGLRTQTGPGSETAAGALPAVYSPHIPQNCVTVSQGNIKYMTQTEGQVADPTSSQAAEASDL